MSRKILSLIVAVAFVLTTISTAFAATLPSDVTGDASKAVSEMQSLNIMIGDAGTGLFRPNDTIKRSEFAVVAVKAMGLNDTAVISAGATKFSDVAADNWASGYINAAVGAGLISGYPDGTFKPDNTINYAEAVTILGNMLGYGPILAGKPWPGAYVAQANASGITSGVTMAPTVGASRGNVAKLVSNTLGANELQISSYDVSGKPIYATVVNNTTKSLMEDKLNVKQIKDLAPNYSLTADNKEYKVLHTPAVQTGATPDVSTLVANNGTGIADKTYKFVSSLNANDYLGLNINAWYNSDGLICVAQVTNNASDIYDGVVAQDGTANMKLVGNNNASYGAVATGFKGYLNGVQENDAAGYTAIWNAIAHDNGQGRVVLSNGLIAFANIITAAPGASFSDDSSSVKMVSYVVSDVTDGYVNSINSQQQAWKPADFKGYLTNQTRQVNVIKDGKVATIDDIKANDVVTEIKNGSNYTFIVTENAVTGTLSASSGTDLGATITVGTGNYTFATSAIYENDNTITDAKPFGTWPDATGFYNLTKGAVGTSVTVYLNAVGQIAFVGCAAGSNTYYYGIVRSFSSGIGANLDYAVTLYKSDATKVSYVFDNDANVAGYNASGYTTATMSADNASPSLKSSTGYETISQGDLVQYQLTSAGKIKDGTFLRIDDPKVVSMPSSDGKFGTTTATDNNVLTNGSNASVNGAVVTSGTIIFDTAALPYLNAAGGDVTVLPYSAIKGVANIGTAQVLVNTGVVKVMRINVSNLAAATGGVVINTGMNTDGKTIIVNENGTTKTYEDNTGYDATKFAYFASGVYVEYKVDSSGKISSIDESDNNRNANYSPNQPYISTFDLNATGEGATASVYGYGSVSATGSNIVKVISIDTANNLIKYNHIKLDGTYAADGTDLYFRYDPANLNVYDVTDKGNKNIVGGKDISAVKAGSYIWIGGGKGATYDLSRILVIKLDDITKYNGTTNAH